MGGGRRALAVLLALGASAAAAAPVAAVLPTPSARALVPAPPRHLVAAPSPAAAPTPLPTPGDPAAAGRRRLRADNSVDEGFLLGLPGAGPKGPTAYVPPEPRSPSADAGALVLAALAGLLAAVGTGALLLFRFLRPRRTPRRAPVRGSVALAPASARRPRSPGQRRRTTRLSRDVFDRLPPLVQLALLDRVGPHDEIVGEEAGAPVPPAAG